MQRLPPRLRIYTVVPDPPILCFTYAMPYLYTLPIHKLTLILSYSTRKAIPWVFWECEEIIFSTNGIPPILVMASELKVNRL